MKVRNLIKYLIPLIFVIACGGSSVDSGIADWERRIDDAYDIDEGVNDNVCVLLSEGISYAKDVAAYQDERVAWNEAMFRIVVEHEALRDSARKIAELEGSGKYPNYEIVRLWEDIETGCMVQ